MKHNASWLWKQCRGRSCMENPGHDMVKPRGNIGTLHEVKTFFQKIKINRSILISPWNWQTFGLM
jgi:hypothetical protein